MRDAGLQAERTALAWSRTVLGMVVNALILLRTGLAYGGDEVTAIGALLLAAAAATYVFGRRRRHALMSSGGAPLAPPVHALIAVAAITALASVGGMLALAATLHR